MKVNPHSSELRWAIVTPSGKYLASFNHVLTFKTRETARNACIACNRVVRVRVTVEVVE